MKFAFVLLGMLFFAVGCITTGNGVMRQQTYSNIAVEKLSAYGQWNITVNCNAAENSCTIIADENLWEFFEITYDRNTKLKTTGNIWPTQPITVVVNTTTDLKSIELENAAQATVLANCAPVMKAEIENAANLQMQKSKVQTYDVEMENAADFTWEDSPNRIKIKAENACQIKGSSVGKLVLIATNNCNIFIDQVDEAQVTLSNATDLVIRNITNLINGSVRGGSDITFSGTTNCGVACYGGSSVVRQQ